MHKKHFMKGPFFLTFPGAKNITQNALLLAAFGNGVSELSNIDISPETKSWINALHQVGIVTQLDEEFRSCILAGANQIPKKQANLTCGNSTNILNLLLTLCATSPGVYYIDGESNLRDLPIVDILKVLHQQGVRFIPDDSSCIPLTVIGSRTLAGGELKIEETISESFISNLLMLAPFAQTPVHFIMGASFDTHLLDKTCTMMAEFGVLVHRVEQNEFFVPIPQTYQARDYEIEADFSLAPYFFAFAAISQNQLIIPTNHATGLTDNKCVSLLEKMGCHFEKSTTEFSVQGPRILQGIEVSFTTFSDSVIMLAMIAPFANTPTHISFPFLSHEDKKLLTQLKDVLETLDVKIESNENTLHIFPSIPKASMIDIQQNPRLAMAMKILSLKIPGIQIDDDQCIRDHHPEFFMLWNQLTHPSYELA